MANRRFFSPAGSLLPMPLCLIAALLLIAPTNASADLTNGLVLYYNFDTNTVPVPDYSGNGHTGAVFGATWAANGRIGGAYTFDGTNDYITAPGYKGVLGSNAMSLSVWAKSDIYNPAGQWILMWGDGTQWGGCFDVGYRGDGNHSVFGVTGGWNLFGGYAPQADGLWHHVAMVTDRSVVSLYIDGQLVSSTNTSNGINVKAKADVSIGREDGGFSYLKGAIDEVRIYDRVLTPSEVAALYESGAGDVVRLVIAGNPGRYGAPLPDGYGTNEAIAAGSQVTNTVASPASGGTGVRHVCTGWTGTGDITNGVGTSVVFSATTNSSLTWNWRTEYWLDAGADLHGSVDVSDGWHTNGASILITAAASNGYRFAHWSCNMSPEAATNNPLVVTMDQARSACAVFVPDAASSLDEGLVLYYNFDSSSTPVEDNSGCGHAGAVYGATWTADGAIGGAYSFDGTDDYISAVGYKGLLGARAMSLSAWARSDSYNYAGQWILMWGDGTQWGGCFDVGYRGDGNHSIFGVTGGWNLFGGYAPQGDGLWHHVAMVTDGNVVWMYVDGQLANSIGTSGGIDVKAKADVSIGREDGGFSYFTGAIDEIRIYDRALATNEVAALYESGVGGVARLVIQGNPGPYGTPSPRGYGTNLVPVAAVVTNSVVSPASGGTGIRYVCTGWSGTGDVTNGIGTSVAFVASTNSTLVWNWGKECYLDTASDSHGSVDVADAWYTNGAMVTITATASNGYHFALWSGAVPLDTLTNNPLTISMDQARSITATFAVNNNGPADGLLLYYSFDSASAPVVDDSGNGHTGTVHLATWLPGGRIGGAYTFSGPSNTIESLGWQPTLGNQSFGASFWVKSTHNYAGSEAGLLTWGYPRPSGLGTWCGIKSAGTDSTNTTIYFDNGGSGTIVARSTINDGIWHHVAVVYDDARSFAAIYVDGVLEASRSISMNVRTGGDLAVGWETYDENIPSFDGSIDEVRVYNRALTTDEVVALYAAGVGPMARLTIEGSPARYGNPSPRGYGTNLVLLSTVVTNSVVSPVTGGTGIRYSCTGWTGSGDATNGNGASVTFTMTTNSTLIWNWRKEFYLDTAAGIHGSVDVGDNWYTNGASVSITATASNGYRFVGWAGSVPAGLILNNPLTVPMDQARTITATFAWGSQGDITTGMILFYPFSTNETPVADASGHGHTGRVQLATWTTNGFAGGAYSFAPLSNKIDVVGWQPTLSNQSFSASFWIRTTNSYSGTEAGLVTWGAPSGLGTWCGIKVGRYASTNTTVYFDNGGAGTIWARTSVNDGIWHHVAVVYDNSLNLVRVYVDGSSETNRTISMNVPIGSAAMAIGAENYNGSIPSFVGTMDEVRIYGRALAADEVAALYALTSGPTAQLVVGGSPDRYGNPVPYGYGTNQSIAVGATITNAVSSPVSGGAGVQHYCTGWSGSGDVTNGNGTSVAFTVTTNSTLTWQWRTEYYLDTLAGANGSVGAGAGWYTNGSAVTITAIPNSSCTFSSWTGDVPAGQEAVNPLTVTMDRARTITAQFTLPTYTLSGQVFYSGSQSGTIYIEAFTNASYLSRVAWTQLSAPGSYALPALAAGRDYWIRGYLDGNGNGSLSSMEPVAGYSGNPILALAASQSGIDIRLQRLTAPQGVSAVGGVGSITLSWNPNPEPGIAGYNIYRFDMEWAVFERLNGAPVAGLTFADFGVEPDEPYFYYVSAVMMSEYMSSYMESPPSTIVGAMAGAINLWMPDYRGPTGSVVRLRINASDARGVLGKDMAITVSYDPAVLTPLSKVDAGRQTVEKTALTQGLTITNNGLTATGQLQIVATGNPALTNHATLRILGCSYDKSPNKPIPILAKYMKNGGEWIWIQDGKNVNNGNPHQVDLGTTLADGTNCVLNVRETDQNHERQSDAGGAYVRVLRDGDSILTVPGVSRLDDVQYCLRGYIDESMTVQMGPKDAIYLFELGSETNGVDAGYQDVVALVEFDEGAGLAAGGHLFDVLFVVATNKTNGTHANHAFVSAVIKDQMGNSIWVDTSDTAVFTVWPNYFLGDINGDGTVNVSGDFTLAMKLAVGQRDATADELMAGDIDGDGAISKGDATLIKRIAMGLPINEGGEPPPFGSNGGGPGGLGYGLSIGQFNVEPGAILQVPVYIDNAAGIANIDLRINYDTSVLMLLGVTNGALTASFGLEYNEGAGYLDVALASSNGLDSSSGTILTMSFYVPESVSLGTMTDLTISRYGLGDELGGDLGWSSGITVTHGMAGVALTNALSILSFGQQDGFEMEWATQWGKTYTIESSTNLMSGFTPLQSGFTGNGTIKTYVDAPDSNCPVRYYRIVEE